MTPKFPNKIYLQIEDCNGDVIKPEDLDSCEITWCAQRINDSDLVYYRRSKVKSQE